MRVENNNDGTYCLIVCGDELRVINASLYGTISSAYREPHLDSHQEHFASVCMKMYEDCNRTIQEIKKNTPVEAIGRCFTCAKVLKNGHPRAADIDECVGICKVERRDS